MSWQERIARDPQVLRGEPCLKGTRLPVALVLGYLACGRNTAGIIGEFPDLTGADVLTCLHYARQLAEHIVPRPYP